MQMRDRIIEAVESLDYRVTIGDVSTRSGLELSLVQQGLNSLAQDAEGHLQVSSTGEIVYAFDRDLRDRLLARDRNAQLKAFLREAWKAIFYLIRISFGVVLVLSLAIVAVGIYLLLSSRDNDGDSRSDRGGGGPGFIPSFLWFDLWYIFQPPIYGTERDYNAPREPGFLQSVFSFLFGDGNPNAQLEETRWQTVASVIQANEGVVVAEQLAPYLEKASTENEDFVLPALVKFDGFPEVSDEGDIVYRFPQLQVQAAAKNASPARLPAFLQEQLWKFSNAPSGKLVLAGALGALNFVGTWYLYFLLQSRVVPEELAILNLLAPVLVAYGTLFLLIPAVRWLVIQQFNGQIVERNRSRSVFGQQLRTLNAQLKRKLEYARLYTQKKIIGRSDIIYTTEQSTLEQRDYELDDPRFKELEGPQGP